MFFGKKYPKKDDSLKCKVNTLAHYMSFGPKWSIFDYIHFKMRNSLSFSKANDFVFVFGNIKLRDKIFDPNYKKSYDE